MDELVEAFALAGTSYIEERFGRLAACLYVVVLIAVSLGVAALGIALAVQYLQ